MPIFSSILPQLTPLRGPRLPSSFTRNFGTMNSDTPLMPRGGPPGGGGGGDLGQHQMD